MNHLVESQKGKRFVGADCTLDGRPATITGRALRFAVVAQIPQGPRVEYAWPTVAAVMQHDRAFRSGLPTHKNNECPNCNGRQPLAHHSACVRAASAATP